MVMLSVRDERELKRQAALAEADGEPFSMFFEPDLPGQTALAFLPCNPKRMKGLPLALKYL